MPLYFTYLCPAPAIVTKLLARPSLPLMFPYRSASHRLPSLHIFFAGTRDIYLFIPRFTQRLRLQRNFILSKRSEIAGELFTKGIR